MGIRDHPTAPRSPWQNGCAEQVIGSIRRECPDHIILSASALHHIGSATLFNYPCLCTLDLPWCDGHSAKRESTHRGVNSDKGRRATATEVFRRIQAANGARNPAQRQEYRTDGAGAADWRDGVAALD